MNDDTVSGASFSGDPGLDALLEEASRLRHECSDLAMEAGGSAGALDRGLERMDAERQALDSYIDNRLQWLDNATPEQVRRHQHECETELELALARNHEQELVRERADLEEQFIKNQTESQFQAEKAGYRQVHPWSMYRGYTGDPNLFEKDGELYRLDSSGGLTRIPSVPDV